MIKSEPKSVGDMWRLVRDGEQRYFAHTKGLTGDEPPYYRVTTAGEYQVLPRSDKLLDIHTRPRPAFRGLSAIPLGDWQYSFTMDVDRAHVADLYRITPGVFLISRLLLDLLDTHGVGLAERTSAQLLLRSGPAQDFHIVIPTILDIVDIAKTDVKIARNEIIPGTFSTDATFPNGLFFDQSAPLAFLGEYDVDWWWRENLVQAAIRADARGLRAVCSYKAVNRPEIRTL